MITYINYEERRALLNIYHGVNPKDIPYRLIRLEWALLGRNCEYYLTEDGFKMAEAIVAELTRHEPLYAAAPETPVCGEAPLPTPLGDNVYDVEIEFIPAADEENDTFRLDPDEDYECPICRRWNSLYCEYCDCCPECCKGHGEIASSMAASEMALAMAAGETQENVFGDAEYPANEREREHLLSEAYGSDDNSVSPDESAIERENEQRRERQQERIGILREAWKLAGQAYSLIEQAFTGHPTGAGLTRLAARQTNTLQVEIEYLIARLESEE